MAANVHVPVMLSDRPNMLEESKPAHFASVLPANLPGNAHRMIISSTHSCAAAYTCLIPFHGVCLQLTAAVHTLP